MKFLRKKFKFTFQKRNSLSEVKPKDFLGSDSPSEKKYEKLLEEYGDDPAFVTTFGVKIFPSGDQFVIDAKTGRVIARDKTTRYVGRDEDSGFHIYLSEDSELKEEDEAYPSFVKEREAI